MTNRIRGMTAAQTRKACDAALHLSVEWARLQDCIQARVRTGGALADLVHDCYVARTRVAFSARDGELCFGWLTWRLDPLFAPLGPPETELRAWRAGNGRRQSAD